MEKNKDMNEEELKAQQEETLDNVATSQQDEGDKAEEQPAKEMSVEDKLAAAETKVAELQDTCVRLPNLTITANVPSKKRLN